MPQQLDFWDSGPQVIAGDGGGTIVYYPAVFTPREADELFTRLLHDIPWERESRRMFDHVVEVPRLTAHFANLQALCAPLEFVRARTAGLSGGRFHTIGLNLYRDGNDSVAWHNDDVAVFGSRPLIVLASFGATREMRLRPKVGRRAIHRDLEPGSVLLMGGNAQQHWEHCVPKTSRPVAQRISVALRERGAR